MASAQSMNTNTEFGNRALTDDEVKDYVLPCGSHLETCFAFGANAEYYKYIGVGRLISKEEAHALIDRSIIDEGLMPTSVRSAAHEIICLCHADKCNLFGGVRALPEEFTTSVSRKAYSRYDLKFDQEACLKCGLCAQRCAMNTVEMGEDGYPVTGWCVSCGQCGITCPAHARTLVLKPVEDRLPLAQTSIDDNNERAGFRIQNGTL